MTSTGPSRSSVCHARPQRAPRRRRGFTMVELIMVIVIMGVLAAVAVPRLVGSSDVAARGLHDSTLAYLRYAQKAAVAQRRTVCVTFASAAPYGLSLVIAQAAGSLDCVSSRALAGPAGEAAATLAVPTGASYAAKPADFNFDGLGQAINGSTGAALGQSIQVVGVVNTITVEAGTGYVHD